MLGYMGELYDRFKLNKLVNSDDPVSYFKENSIDFYKSYTKSTEQIKAIPVRLMIPGKFYFLHYKDDTNWIKWSPVFVVEEKKSYGFHCMNLNFMPLEIRILFFDKYITDKDFESDAEKKGNHFIKVKPDMVQNELKKIRMNHCMKFYNSSQIVTCHRIMFDDLPNFLFSSHPMFKYDPKKLIQIWKQQASKSERRGDEMMKLTIEDLYNFDKEFKHRFDVLKGHIDRFRKSVQKWG